MKYSPILAFYYQDYEFNSLLNYLTTNASTSERAFASSTSPFCYKFKLD